MEIYFSQFQRLGSSISRCQGVWLSSEGFSLYPRDVVDAWFSWRGGSCILTKQKEKGNELPTLSPFIKTPNSIYEETSLHDF
jgi:hypothetical protein